MRALERVEKLVGKIKPSKQEKDQFRTDFELQILTAAYLRGKIPLSEYISRTLMNYPRLASDN
jgi:hypothetical protein